MSSKSEVCIALEKGVTYSREVKNILFTATSINLDVEDGRKYFCWEYVHWDYPLVMNFLAGLPENKYAFLELAENDKLNEAGDLEEFELGFTKNISKPF